MFCFNSMLHVLLLLFKLHNGWFLKHLLYFLFVCYIDAFGGQIEVLDNLFVDLEEVCEQLDLERRKSAQGLKLNMLRHNRE